MPGKRITPKQKILIEQVRAGKVQQYVAETGAVRWKIMQADTARDATPGEARSLDALAQRGVISVRAAIGPIIVGTHSPVTLTESKGA